jgi:cyclic pyranopterin phosphate synthase
MSTLLDRRRRPLRDLRISVTDRCNFRCGYCMPKEVFGRDFQFLPRSELLSFEEIARVARVFAREGVSKLRITGGEPLLRRELERLVDMLARIPGIEDFALTTNGALLPPRARALADAGLRRVSVSLDALDDVTFHALNDVAFPVARVLAAIDAAAEAGMAPVKINMVVRRGVNDDCVLEMAEHFRNSGHVLRMIEFMDVGTTNGWVREEVVSAAEIRERIHAIWPLRALRPDYPGEVANRFAYVDGAGEIGLIASVTEPFCGGCTRARLSADGRLHTCLFGATGHDLRALLRNGAGDEEIAARLRAIWTGRTDRYSELRASRASQPHRVEMSYIGG